MQLGIFEQSKSPEEILRTKFGYETFRTGQLGVIQSVLAGKDAMAVMPTGGGKSLCYQIPALVRPGIVIVISPLISLMRDQVETLKDLKIPAGAIYSGQDEDEKRKVFYDLSENENFLLYVSPERVQHDGFQKWVRAQKRITLIAIDESHCVSQWGPDFRQDYHKLATLRELCPGIPVLALTATATPPVLADIIHQLRLKNPDRHIYGFYRPNLYYQVQNCASDAEKLGWLKQALRQFPTGRVLIYCGTRKQSSELADDLKSEFESIDYYHAGRTAGKRTSIQNNYDNGKTRILCATNAFGMGIDHPDVRLVIHYQMPANIESLYQEMGRAGRDGVSSTCLLLYSKKDKGLQSYFIQRSDAPREIINSKWRALDTITQYCEVEACRHAGILTYFRDPQRMQHCGHCDICDPGSERKVQAAPIVARVFGKATKGKKSKSVSSISMNPEQEAHYEELKTWRKSYAEEHDTPAFMVFSNKTLEDLIQKMPQSSDALLEVYGFGAQKVEMLGPDLIRKIKELLE